MMLFSKGFIHIIGEQHFGTPNHPSPTFPYRGASVPIIWNTPHATF